MSKLFAIMKHFIYSISWFKFLPIIIDFSEAVRLSSFPITIVTEVPVLVVKLALTVFESLKPFTFIPILKFVKN